MRFDRTPTRGLQQKVDVTESKRTGKSEKNNNEGPVLVRSCGGWRRKKRRRRIKLRRKGTK